MLDLIKLEKQLDESLDKETTESLLEWLNNKRETFISEPESLSDVEAKVIKIFAVDQIEYDFGENKFGNRDKLEKYFEENIKQFVLNKIIQYKMNTGDNFHFSEREQEAGVWQIDIEVYLDDWYFD